MIATTTDWIVFGACVLVMTEGLYLWSLSMNDEREIKYLVTMKLTSILGGLFITVMLIGLSEIIREVLPYYKELFTVIVALVALTGVNVAITRMLQHKEEKDQGGKRR